MRRRNRRVSHAAPVDRLEPRRLLSHTYYVSPTGSNAAAGTSQAAAWQTVAAVNATTLVAGDTVLFEGGAEFTGTLTLGAKDAGTAAEPITISSYGTGRAEISAGAADGIDVLDTSGIAISNLNIEGSSPTNDTSEGIKLFNDRASGGRLGNGVSITEVDVGGFGLFGIGIGAATVTNGFDDVSVTHATLHNDDEAGLETYAGAYTVNPAPYGMAHDDIYVGYVTSYDNAGNTIHLDSGNGILLGDVEDSTVEHCAAYDNGLNREGEPCGIWTYNSDHVTIQYNESYGNAGGPTDGDGFDLDGGTTNAILQYNYSHDNTGTGYLLCQFANGTAWGNNIVRYNISQNDGGALNYAGIDLWAASNSNSLGACDIYGNTIYESKTGSRVPKGIEIDVATTNVHIRNNIFDVTAGGQAIQVDNAGTGLLFQGNDYWANSSATAGLYWLGTTYTTLAAWRTASGQEKLNSAPVGLAVNPQLADAGGGGTVGPGGNLATLSAYRLTASSPLINAGVNLTSLGLSVGSNDFFGQPIPSGSAFDIGADEVQLAPPGPLTLASTGAAYLELSPGGASLQVWTVATPGGSAPSESVSLSALTGVTVPAGTALTIDASNGSLTATVPLTFAGGAATTVKQVGTSSKLAATVAAGATVAFAGTQTLGSLAVAAGGKATVANTAAGANGVLVLGTLALASTSVLDLTDNDLVVTGDSLSAMTDAAANGYGNGAWNGKGGLTSSTAAADASHLTAVGVIAAPAATTFGGVAVPAGAILAKYTYYGDANLDGKVDIADYTRTDAGFIAHLTGWANGDFNYDGVVDGSDFTLIDNAFKGQSGSKAFTAALATAAPAAELHATTFAASPSASQVSTLAAAATIAFEQQQEDAKRHAALLA
jgi:hypothetical protein